MLHTSLVWKGGNVFEGSGAGGGPPVTIQAGPSEGERRGPSAKEAVLIGLCACSGVDVVDILAKMRQNLESLEVIADAETAERDPKYLTAGTLAFRARGDGLEADKVRRAVHLSLERYCGVAATLSGKMAIAFEVWVNGERVQEQVAAVVP